MLLFSSLPFFIDFGPQATASLRKRQEVTAPS